MSINQTVKNISIAWIEARARIVLNTTLVNINEFGGEDTQEKLKAYQHYFESVDNAKKWADEILKKDEAGD